MLLDLNVSKPWSVIIRWKRDYLQLNQKYLNLLLRSQLSMRV